MAGWWIDGCFPEPDGKQGHIASFLGWRGRIGEPRLTNVLVAEYTYHLVQNDIVVSWDVPIDNCDSIPERFLRRRTAVGERIGRIAG